MFDLSGNIKERNHIEIQKILIHQLHYMLSEENYINEELKLKKKNKIKCPKKISGLLTMVMLAVILLNINKVQSIITVNFNDIKYIAILLIVIFIVLIGITTFLLTNYLITTFNIKEIKINGLWNLEIVKFIIENNKLEFNYYSLKEYKERQKQELNKLKPIIDELIGYTYKTTGENCYLSDGIKEKNQEILQYILVELSEYIKLDKYLEIVANNIMIISNIYEFIKDTIFSNHFLFLESIISGQFKNKNIPVELNNENGKRILKEICKEKGLKLTQKKVKRKE